MATTLLSMERCLQDNMASNLFLKTGAVLSDDEMCRFTLIRIWLESAPRLVAIGLNPSTADSKLDDSTIRILMGRARRLNFGGLLMMNLFALRATDPKVLLTVPPAMAIGEGGDKFLLGAFKQPDQTLLMAWGDGGDLYGRNAQVVKMMVAANINKAYCLGLTKGGQPKHPLRIPYSCPMYCCQLSADGTWSLDGGIFPGSDRLAG